MFVLIALILVIVGIVVLARYNQWAGIALIVLGVMVFLLRDALKDGTEDVDEDGLRAMAVPLLVIPKRVRARLQR